MPHEEKDEPSFQVKDNRRFNQDGTMKEDAPEISKPQKENGPILTEEIPFSPHTPSPFEINFPTFVLSLASSAQISLGLIPHPMTQKPEVNLVSAKQTIDILGMLEEKTKGNLSEEEDHLLRQVLFELRMQFVEISNKAKK